MQQAGSAWERDGSPTAATREMAAGELQEMPVMDLLSVVEAAGITLAAEGDRLQVRGPQKAEALGRLLLERKSEVLAVLALSRPQTAEESAATEASAACGSLAAADSAQWDAQRAAALIAEVDAQIEIALLTEPMADKAGRRNVLANERLIVRRLTQRRDPFLWEWPQALRRLLDRWKEQSAEGNL